MYNITYCMTKSMSKIQSTIIFTKYKPKIPFPTQANKPVEHNHQTQSDPRPPTWQCH